MEFPIHEFAGCLLCSLCIALVMLKVPNNALCVVGQLKFLTPNWISVWHTPLAWSGYILYLYGHWFIGFQIVVVAAVMDRLDGRIARLLSSLPGAPMQPKGFWDSLFHPGKSEWGEHIDPAMDKLAILPIYSHMLYLTHIDVVLFSVLVCTEAFGTFIRMRMFKRLLKGAAATWAGKTKSLLQWLLLIIYAPLGQGWVPDKFIELYGQIMYFGLAVILVFAVISVFTKFRWGNDR